MKLVGCAALALAMIAGAANAGDWRLTTASSKGAIGVDLETVRVDSPRRAWTVVLFPETNSTGADYALVRVEIDCVAETMAKTNYAVYNAAGSSIERNDRFESSKPVIPDSGEASILDAVCFNRFTIPDPSGWTNVNEMLIDYRSTLED